MAATGVAPTAGASMRPGVQIVAGAAPEPSPPAACGSPTPAQLDVAGLLAAYAPGAARPGAEIRHRCEVDALADRVRLDASRGPPGRRRPTVAVDVVVNAAGAWGDVVAERAGVAPLGLRPLRRTACIVPAPTESRRGRW